MDDKPMNSFTILQCTDMMNKGQMTFLFDRKSVNAIIDSGAGVNIISSKEFKHIMKTMSACTRHLRFKKNNENM